jgi:MscS family membrane protein
MIFEILKKAFLPVAILILLIAGYAFYNARMAQTMPEGMQKIVGRCVGTIFVISIAFVVQSVVNGMISWYAHNVVEKTVTDLDDKLLPILDRTVKVIIWMLALVVILPMHGLNISGFVAAFGVSSLVIGMAAQDTIANIIAGFMIMVDAPFMAGDRIKLPSGEIVEVLEIQARRSKFLAEDKSVIIVPNIDLSKSKIINYSPQK